MLETCFTRLVGCTVPIQQAGMGAAVANPQLAAAVAGAGGLGMVTVSGYTPAIVVRLLSTARQLTSGTIGANFLLVACDSEGLHECVAAAAEHAVVDQGVTGAVEAMSLGAGESVTGVKQVRPAAEIVRELADEAEQLPRRWTARE
jgi:NAD(P)H-dependent flavin oxidoreductase YrpB (nitropropane dioxygenase family)